MENKPSDESSKEKEKLKEKNVKKSDKAAKKVEKAPEENQVVEEKRNGDDAGATGASEENGEFQPMELPPFEIVTGWVKFSILHKHFNF